MEQHTNEPQLPSEYELDLFALRDRFLEIEEHIYSDDLIDSYERGIQLQELRTWYESEEDGLLQGDGKSAHILVDNGFADNIEP